MCSVSSKETRVGNTGVKKRVVKKAIGPGNVFSFDSEQAEEPLEGSEQKCGMI